MKRYAIPVVVILAVLAVSLSALAQAQNRANQRQGNGARTGRGRMMLSSEDQQKAINAIEEQLVKLKAVAQIQRPEGGFQNMSQEDRNKMMTAFRDRRTALQAIIAQVALLEGRRQPEGENARFIIINTADLKPIQEAATKEKAEETGKLLERLMTRGSGRGRGGSGQRPQGQGGQGRQRQQRQQ